MTENFESLRRQLERLGTSDGITSSYIIFLPDTVRKLLNKMVRQGPLPAAEIALELGLTAEETDQILEILLSKKIILAFPGPAAGEAMRYGVQLGRTRPPGALR